MMPVELVLPPPRPAIIRATELPRSPAEARGITMREAYGPAPVFMAVGTMKKRGEGGITSISLFGSSTSAAGATITAPASIQAGDILVLAQMSTNGGGAGPTAVNPSGFTTIGYDDDLNGSFMLSYKLAAGTEGGASLTGMNGSFSNAKALYVFRPNIPATGLTVGSFPGTMSQNDPTGVTVTASAGVAPLVVVGGYGGGSGAITRTFSPAKDGEIQGAATYACWLAYKIYNSSPQDTTIDTADAGNFNCVHGAYIRPTV